jgi:hypothetical protein
MVNLEIEGMSSSMMNEASSSRSKTPKESVVADFKAGSFSLS